MKPCIIGSVESFEEESFYGLHSLINNCNVSDKSPLMFTCLATCMHTLEIAKPLATYMGAEKSELQL